MSTYRKTWDCCGSATETEAWEPEECPFCCRRAPVSVALPARRYKQSGPLPEDVKPYSSHSEGWDDALDAVEDALRAAVITVKEKP